MGGGESKDRGKENGDVPAAPADTGRKLKSKSQKEQRVTMSQIHNKTLIEVVEDGKVGSVKLKLQRLKEQFTREVEGDVRANKLRSRDVQAEVAARMKDELNQLDREKLSALHYAARDEHPNIAKVLIAAGADPNIQNQKMSTPLHAAAKSVHDTTSNREDVITVLLNAHANVNAQDANGITPIHLAAYRDNVVGVQKLLQAENIDIHVIDKQGQTVLHHAAASDANSVIKALQPKLSLRDVQLVDNNGQTALHVACRYAAKDSFSTLIEFFAASQQDMTKVLCQRDKDGNTPFHLAAASGDMDTLDNFVRFLDQQTFGVEDDGAEWEWDGDAVPEACPLRVRHLCRLANKDGETPLHLAAMAGTRYNVETLLDRVNNVGIDTEDKKERSPLHGAVLYNNTEVVELLVDRGASIAHVDENWESVVLVAARVSKAVIMEILLRRDPPAYEIRYDTDADEKNPLHVAAARDDPDLLSVLLKYCKDTDDDWLLDTPDRNNNSPLHIAAEKGKIENVQALLDFSAEVDLKNADLNTPTHLAAKYGRHQVVDAMATFDREVMKTGDDDGNTALHIACVQGHERVAKILIKAGADVQARNRRHQTPLYVSCKHGHAKICKMLLKAGAEPNPRKPSRADVEAGITAFPVPLHVACKEGHAELVTLLIRNHADVRATNDDGHNCLNIAIMNAQREAAVAVLKSEKWQDALKNESYERLPRRRRTTPLRQLIEKMPDVAEIVFNQCVNFEEDVDPETGKARNTSYETRGIALDFQFIEDELAPWTKVGSRSKNLRKRHPLKLMADLRRVQLLSHPLVVDLLDRKWWQTIWMYALIFVLYAVYLFFLTGYMLVNEPPYRFKREPGYDRNNSDQCERIRAVTTWSDFKLDSSSLKWTIFIDIGQWVIMGICIISIVGEVVQFVYRGRKYIRSVENYVDLCSYILALVLVISTTSCQRDTGIRTDVQWQIGAFAMFLSWINLVLFYKMFPRLGMYVYMFSAITATFIGVLRVFVLYIVAFGLTFYVLMQNQVEFGDVWVSIVKAGIMTTGEFEFFDIVHGEEENPGDDAHILHYSVLVRILLLVFASMMTVLLMNLLVGLAVGDIQGLQENATLQKLRIQVEQTLDAEYYWLSRFLRHALQKRRAQGVVVRAGDTNHEELKAVALIEREEMQQMSLEASREEMDARLDKHMNKQNKQLTELIERIEDQERQNEETRRMLRKVLRQLNADKDNERLTMKLTNQTDEDVKCVYDWGGVLKTTRVTLNPGDRYEDSALHDEPHTLYLFLGDTKLEYHFNPDKMNEYTVYVEEEELKLKNAAGDVVRRTPIVKFTVTTQDDEDDDDW